METLPIGGTPAEEQCAQTGVTEGAQRLNRLECRAYIVALERKFGPPPEGSRLAVVGSSHDFGTYYEAAFRYDPADEAADAYGAKVEAGLAKWSDADMWPPVTYDNKGQPVLVIEDATLWVRATNPQCFNTVERLATA